MESQRVHSLHEAVQVASKFERVEVELSETRRFLSCFWHLSNLLKKNACVVVQSLLTTP